MDRDPLLFRGTTTEFDVSHRRRRSTDYWMTAFILLLFTLFLFIFAFVNHTNKTHKREEIIDFRHHLKRFHYSLLLKEKQLMKWNELNLLAEERKRLHKFNSKRKVKVLPIRSEEGYRRICYYTVPIIKDATSRTNDLNLSDINGTICTHINIGNTYLNVNHSLIIKEEVHRCLSVDLPQFRQRYPHLKFLLWIGGANGDSSGFRTMIQNHANRKLFLKSLKTVLDTYHLDGCDLDWEFPTAYNRERQHFSQLLYEIRKEYQREHRPSALLSVAVAAVEGIAYFAYDVQMINKYADHVNLMSYDYHAYTKMTPFTGLNAPLYGRKTEHLFFSTLNMNYSVNWWISNGLDRRKLMLGLPTYGHTFRLVNPFNRMIGAPASGTGTTGQLGFVTYGDVCWFKHLNFGALEHFDREACSPYLSDVFEWMSFETPDSIHCKVEYIKEMNLGGAMLFSLNSDDHKAICNRNIRFPLGQMMANILRK